LGGVKPEDLGEQIHEAIAIGDAHRVGNASSNSVCNFYNKLSAKLASHEVQFHIVLAVYALALSSGNLCNGPGMKEMVEEWRRTIHELKFRNFASGDIPTQVVINGRRHQ